MRFTLKLDNPYKLGAYILAVAGIGLGVVWMIISNLVVRGMADQRSQPSRELLAAAASRFPNSARINFRLASAELQEGAHDSRYYLLAEIHAEQAVDLSPWNVQARSLLATIQELNGKPWGAEKSLRAAIKLAPNYAEVNWEFANLLLRRGKLAESFAPFRIATRARTDLLPTAIETVWLSSNGSLEVLRAFAGNDPEAMLAETQLLIGRKLIDDAVEVFNSIDIKEKAHLQRTPEVISALSSAGRPDLARTAWVELMAAVKEDTRPATTLNVPRKVSEAKEITNTKGANERAALIWNGGFETDSVEGLNQFDWLLRSDKYAWVTIDRGFFRTGSRSLKVVFSGLDTTTMRDQVQQALVLKTGAAYKLECYAKAKNLITPEGPRIAVIGPKGIIGESDPVLSGSDEWQKLDISFVVPAGESTNQTPATLAIVRTPKFSYDDPTSGEVWFDDFNLSER